VVFGASSRFASLLRRWSVRTLHLWWRRGGAVDGPLTAESFLFVLSTVDFIDELRVELITLRTGPAEKVNQLLVP
jgi:hypothetical protein